MVQSRIVHKRKQLVIARNYNCFKHWCRKMERSPQDQSLRYISSEMDLRGYTGKTAEIVIVCGGPYVGKAPDLPTSNRYTLEYERQFKHWANASRHATYIMNAVRYLNDVYGIDVRHDKCT